MNNTGACSIPNPVAAFGIDPNHVNISEMFSACLRCLDSAADNMKNQNHLNCLRINLLRLRLSRCGECHGLYDKLSVKLQSSKDKQLKAKLVFSELLGLLEIGDVFSEQFNLISSSESTPLASLLAIIDSIVIERGKALRGTTVHSLPLSYRGNVSWSTQQFEQTGSMMDRLEQTLGSVQELRQLSRGEQQKIAVLPDLVSALPGNALDNLEIAAKEIDVWTLQWIPGVRRGEERLQNGNGYVGFYKSYGQYTNTGAGSQFNGLGFVFHGKFDRK